MIEGNIFQFHGTIIVKWNPGFRSFLQTKKFDLNESLSIALSYLMGLTQWDLMLTFDKIHSKDANLAQICQNGKMTKQNDPRRTKWQRFESVNLVQRMHNKPGESGIFGMYFVKIHFISRTFYSSIKISNSHWL